MTNSGGEAMRRLSLAERMAGLSPEKRLVLERLLEQQRLAARRSTSPSADPAESPLSFGQLRLWFLDRLEPGSSSFHISTTLEWLGPLDHEALRRSFETIVRRHQVLRTAFVDRDGAPVARVVPESPFELPVETFEAVEEEERRLEVVRRARAEVERPFDLSRGELLRARVLRPNGSEPYLVVTVHHIAFDAWSVPILFGELFAAYEAFSLGSEPKLAELPGQYADFARTQRERLSGETLESEVAYWREKLRDLPQESPLPTDRPRPVVARPRAGRASMVLSLTTAAAMKELTRKEGATFFMGLLTTFALLLHRRSGETDVVVGSPISGRSRAETSRLIGFFVNNLVLRTDLSSDPTFRELLGRVRDVAREAYAHEEVPFEKLVEELHPERSLQRNPLFQIVFTLQPAPSLATGDIRVRPVRVETDALRYDLEFYLQDGASGLQALCFYDRELFDAETVETLLHNYEALLRTVTESPDRRLSQISILTGAERKLLVEWTRTERDYPRKENLADLFTRVVGGRYHRVAVECGEETLTYRELDERSNRLARFLVREGVGPETAVGLAFDRSIAAVSSMLAVVKAGGFYVPLDASYPEERLRFMLEDARLALVLTEEKFLPRLPKDVCPIRCLDRDGGAIAALASDPVFSSTSPDNLAYVMYTSGSTGRPKGVEIRQRSIARLVFGGDYAALGPEETILQLAPVSFDASTFEIWGALLWGGRLVIYPDRLPDADELARTIESKEITTLWLTGALFNAVVDRNAGALAGLRQVLAGGEALSVAHLRRAQEHCPETRFINGYGPTEGTTFTCCYSVPDLSKGTWSSIPIGRPIANTRVLVLDESGELVPPGVPGELYLGGEGLARGYRHRPELTAERFVPDPWGTSGERLYRTGDRVRWLRDGTLEFLSRVDEQVKLRGYRVEPGEVEAALREMNEVQEVAVVVRETAPLDRQLVAYWVPSRGGNVDGTELKERLSRRLPDYMVPSSFRRLESLPLTPSGKLDRRALLSRADETELEKVGSGPRGPIEEALAEMFRSLLSTREEVLAHDDFFELGGHSLLATRLVARLRETFRVELPLRVVFESPTVSSLAERIEVARGSSSAKEATTIPRIPREGSLPLSFSQQRLWFLEELEPGSSAYNISGAIRFVGELDASILERSLTEIVRRHESLRSRFETRDGKALLVIDPPGPSPLARVDLEGLEDFGGAVPERREAEALRVASADAVRPFDLSRGGLLRTTLLRLDARDHVLLLTMHHIVSDAWSLGVLVREIGVLYRAFHAGESSPLSELDVQVTDYAAWQRRSLEGERLERELLYWRRQLADVPVLELPTDRPRPAVQTFEGARETAVFPKELAEALAELSREESATLFMTLLAAFQALLSRLSGQDDVVVGSPVANRQLREVEGLIGFFANNLVLRADLSGDPSFRELVARVRETALEAYDHQDLPFERLVDELAPERSLSRNPLFQITFSLQTAPQETLELPGLTLGRLPQQPRRTRFDLEFNLWNRADGLRAVVFYNTDLFDASTIRRMLSQYRGVLEAVTADPARPVSRLPLLSASERSRLLAEWGAGSRLEAVPWPVAGIHERFEEMARVRPDAAAVAAPGEPPLHAMTYHELNRRANRWAHVLRGLGAGPEKLVAIAVERSPDLVLAVLAVLKSGAAYVPLDPDYPEERLAYLLEDAGAEILLVDEAGEAKLPAGRGRRLRIDQQGELFRGASDESPEPVTRRDHRAYVIYTSGSTGRPKGVEVTHGNVLRLFERTTELFRFDENDVFTLFHSFAFDFSVWEMWGALLFGGRLQVVPYWVSRSPEAFLELLREREVTVLSQTPSAFRQLSSVESSSEVTAPLSLRYVVFGGEALDLESLRPWVERHGCERPRLVNMYGITETTVHVTFRPIDASDLETPWRSAVGRALPDLDIYVLDENLEPVPPGVDGELYVGGAGLARGYLGRPELTAERFVPDPFAGVPGRRLYKSGDRARHREGGDLEYRGRSDHQVKIRGFRIELGEIEARLGAHPAVREVVVAVREDSPGHRRLVAFVVVKPEAETSASELRGHAAAALPDYMVPAAYVFLASLPVTAHGKIDRKRLSQLAPSAELADPEAQKDRSTSQKGNAPQTEAERILAAVWEEVLGVEGVSRTDNFFGLGGDSILSLQVVSRANERGLSLTARKLFQHQTLEALAAAAEEGKSGRVSARAARPRRAEAESDGGLFPLTPIQTWFFESFESAPEAAHHYNQSILLELTPGARAEGVSRALDALLRHHDALRLRFHHQGATSSQGVETKTGAAVTRVDLTALDPSDRPTAIEGAAALAQTSVDPARGPLARWVFFDLGPGEPPRLLWVLHHLVVDGVSWRILLEEFRRGYECFARGEALDLGGKTTSYRSWARALADLSRSPELKAELSFWERQAAGAVPRLPVELEGRGENRERDLEHVRVSLDAETTKLVLQEFPRRFRSRIQEVLLTALAEALRRFTGRDELLIHMEGHGREELSGELDLSRTVGWFTSLYPLRVTLPPGGRLVDSLRSVKDVVRTVPRNGIGYGVLRSARLLNEEAHPEVSFNYLGQLDPSFSEASLFRMAKESVGPVRSPCGKRRHLMDVSAIVSSGKLQLDWMYPRTHYRRETIEALARDFLGTLERLAAASPDESLAARSASDFDLVALEPETLQRILSRPRGPHASSEIEDLYPLSSLQEGMLFHGRYAPGSKDYLVQVGWTLEGSFDVPRFERAWNDVVERHSILRTSFDWESHETPLAVVHRSVDLPFVFLEDFGDDPEALQAFLRQDREAPLSPAEAPLLRIAVLRLSSRRHRFVWTFHHLLLDGWSLGRVLREVFSCYEARGRGQRAALEPAVSFREYIAWLQSRDPGASEAFWREELRDFAAPTPLGLDDDYGAPSEEAEEANEGSTHQSLSAVFSEEASDALRRFARERRLTLNTLFQGSWAYLLSRYSGEKDVLFGATVSGRPAALAGVEAMVGLFINTIPVRARLRDDVSAARFFDELQDKQAEAREFEHEALVDIQGWSDVARGTPLFESLFVFENFPVDRRVGGGRAALTASGFSFWTHTHYPLHFRVRPGREILLDLSYDGRRFDRATAELILRHFRTVLERATSDPQRPLARLLPAESVAGEGRARARRRPRDFRDLPASVAESSIPARVSWVAARFPERPALVTAARSWSYRDLDREAHRVANAIARISEPGGRVGLLFGHDAPMVAGMLGTLAAGQAYVPLDPHYPRERLAYVLEDSRAQALLVDEEHLPLARELSAGGLPLLRFEELVEDESLDGERLPEPLPDSLAYLLYTSGSTGEPKGTMQSHRNVLHHIRNYANSLHLRSDDRLTLLSSYGFDASVMSIWGALANGASLHPFDLRSRDLSELAGFVEDRGITIYHSTPTVFRYFLDASDSGARFDAVRAVVLGGEEVTMRDVERYREHFPRTAVLVNGLGPTESTVSLQYFIDHSTELRGRHVPVGYPVEGLEVWLLDDEGRRTPVRGEIAFRSAHLALGYWNRPEQTRAAFLPDPSAPDRRLYRTGDLGRFRADGALEFLGRKDFQVKIRGHRVEPGEIEAVLERRSGVKECVVVPRDLCAGETRLVAYVVGNASLEPTSLREDLRKELPEHMVPADFVLLDRMPLTPTGKIDRRALPEPEVEMAPSRDREAAAEEPLAPRTPVEEELYAIWSEVLGREGFGVRDRFFDLGGHSLLATRVVMRIREAFDVELPLRRLFERTTVEDLALAVVELLLEQEPEEEATDLLKSAGADGAAFAESTRENR